jgi:prepilin-type N-terminal cleavage/methylation domain-containing protein
MRLMAAFTLLELLVVIAVMGVLAGAAAPAVLRSWDQQHLRQYAVLTVAEVNNARYRAISSERSVHVKFNRNYLCTWYATEPAELCQRSAFRLPDKFTYRNGGRFDGELVFTPGRGFAAFSSGRTTLVDTSRDNHIEFILSSLGRMRWCQYHSSMAGVPDCG